MGILFCFLQLKIIIYLKEQKNVEEFQFHYNNITDNMFGRHKKCDESYWNYTFKEKV